MKYFLCVFILLFSIHSQQYVHAGTIFPSSIQKNKSLVWAYVGKEQKSKSSSNVTFFENEKREDDELLSPKKYLGYDNYYTAVLFAQERAYFFNTDKNISLLNRSFSFNSSFIIRVFRI